MTQAVPKGKDGKLGEAPRTGRFEMSALTVRLLDSLHRRLGEVAEREGVSIDQFINSAVAEKISAMMTGEYLHARAVRGARGRFAAALANVADVEPNASDRMVKEPKKRGG